MLEDTEKHARETLDALLDRSICEKVFGAYEQRIEDLANELWAFSGRSFWKESVGGPFEAEEAARRLFVDRRTMFEPEHEMTKARIQAIVSRHISNKLDRMIQEQKNTREQLAYTREKLTSMDPDHNDDDDDKTVIVPETPPPQMPPAKRARLI